MSNKSGSGQIRKKKKEQKNVRNKEEIIYGLRRTFNTCHSRWNPKENIFSLLWRN